MEKVEAKASGKIRQTRIQDALVKTLYAATAIVLAVAAPNTVQLLRRVDPDISKKRHPSRRMSQAVSRLISRGLVKKIHNRGIALTEKGRRYGKLLHSKEQLHVKKPKRWDGRWRIVIFDVWERRRPVRDQLRSLLMKIGFVKVQDSVWAYPYDCEEVIAFIKADLRLGKGMLYLIAEGIEGDREMRRHFSLPM